MSILATIHSRLETYERERGVRILFAVESGSRAWGFASSDSDYDVRFVYAHPRDWYLSVFDRDEVIESPSDPVYDLGGWDLRKALRLLGGSNAPLAEWLRSPLVYREAPGCRDEFLRLAQKMSPRTLAMHHLSLLRNFDRDFLGGPEVCLKKLFYALRSALAARWIAERDEIPPVEFAVLRQLVPESSWQADIERLLPLKCAHGEGFCLPAAELPLDWLRQEAERLLALAPALPARKPDPQALDAALRRWTCEAE